MGRKVKKPIRPSAPETFIAPPGHNTAPKTQAKAAAARAVPSLTTVPPAPAAATTASVETSTPSPKTARAAIERTQPYNTAAATFHLAANGKEVHPPPSVMTIYSSAHGSSSTFTTGHSTRSGSVNSSPPSTPPRSSATSGMTPERIKVYGTTMEAHLNSTAPKGTDICVLALGDRQNEGPAALQQLQAEFQDAFAALEMKYLIHVREILTLVSLSYPPNCPANTYLRATHIFATHQRPKPHLRISKQSTHQVSTHSESRILSFNIFLERIKKLDTSWQSIFACHFPCTLAAPRRFFWIIVTPRFF